MKALVLRAGMYLVDQQVKYSITNCFGQQIKHNLSKQDLEKIISEFKECIANFRATIKRGIKTEKEFKK